MSSSQNLDTRRLVQIHIVYAAQLLYMYNVFQFLRAHQYITHAKKSYFLTPLLLQVVHFVDPPHAYKQVSLPTLTNLIK